MVIFSVVGVLVEEMEGLSVVTLAVVGVLVGEAEGLSVTLVGG